MTPALSRSLCSVALALFALATFSAANAQHLSQKLQNAVGRWQIIDRGAPQGKAETYLENGKLFGKITETRAGRVAHDVCAKCSGEDKNKPIVNLVFIRNFRPEGDQWVDGTILDPDNGKHYKAKIWADGNNKLRMRGFMGVSVLGRTETWIRLP